jgi:hypothetical protein
MLYFGCHREAGHYFWAPGMKSLSCYTPDCLPWRQVEPDLCPGFDPMRRWARRVENEGEALLHHKNGWTALSLWDRSVDDRGGCSSQFFAEGTFSFEEMVALARETFPEVWQRFRFEVRLAESVDKARARAKVAP